VIKVKYIN